MAGLDPSIILGQTQPQVQNPMDIASKAMALQNMSMQNVAQRQQFNDEQSLRNAYAQNMSVDPNGNPSIDRQGILKNLASTSPSLVPKVQAGFQQMDNEMIKSNLEKASSAAQMLNGLQDAPDEQKQAIYDNIKNSPLAQAAGSHNWPSQYDPSFVNNLHAQSMSHKDYFAQQLEAQKLSIQEKEAGIKSKELDLSLQKPKQEAFKDLMSHAESSRQIPDVKQAYMDRYTAQKIIDLVGKEDPNNLTPAMVTLMGVESAKLATGGVPDTEALQAIVPHDREMLVAQTKQYMLSHPQSSQQGAFVKVMQDYAKKIQGGAQKVIDNNIGKLGEMYKPHISDEDYKNFQEKIVNGNPYKNQNLPPVNMKLPDGRTGTIPAESVDEALKLGAKRL